MKTFEVEDSIESSLLTVLRDAGFTVEYVDEETRRVTRGDDAG